MVKVTDLIKNSYNNFDKVSHRITTMNDLKGFRFIEVLLPLSRQGRGVLPRSCLLQNQSDRPPPAAQHQVLSQTLPVAFQRCPLVSANRTDVRRRWCRSPSVCFLVRWHHSEGPVLPTEPPTGSTNVTLTSAVPFCSASLFPLNLGDWKCVAHEKYLN